MMDELELVDEIREQRSYLDRNRDIAREVDLLFVIPKEKQEVRRSGTWATKRYAEAAGTTYEIISP